ncbi:MAG TPA: hypothetical protein VHU83_23105 [Bryobacteraceae bacterium]|jgi:hypothetical protein|nr:hypothetical protein [Bryobacteraceae bacterium]
MSKIIRVRDVSEPLHSTLKARAAREGMSLSDFSKKELERAAQRPTMREWLERMRQAKPIRGKRTTAEIVRELRDARCRRVPVCSRIHLDHENSIARD